MVIDVSNMEVELRKLGICVKCTVDGRAHMRLDLRQTKMEQGWWESGWIHDQDRWKKGARKLHLQFGHASIEKLKRLIEEAYGRNVKKEDVEGCKKIEEIFDTCETSIKLRKTPRETCGGNATRKGL